MAQLVCTYVSLNVIVAVILYTFFGESPGSCSLATPTVQFNNQLTSVFEL
jgi:hypothetical protein